MSRKPIQIRVSETERQAAEIAAYWLSDNFSEFTRSAIAEKAGKTFRVEMRDSEMLVFFADLRTSDDGSMSTSTIEFLTDTLSAFNFPADWVCVEVNKVAHQFFCARFTPEG